MTAVLMAALVLGSGLPAEEPSAVIEGTASHVGSQFGRLYLALPEHRWGRPGIRVRICGGGGCITRTSTDAGPDLEMQRAGRVADLNVWDFEAVCGCDGSRGLTRVSIEYGVGAARQTLPPTDLADLWSGLWSRRL